VKRRVISSGNAEGSRRSSKEFRCQATWVDEGHKTLKRQAYGQDAKVASKCKRGRTFIRASIEGRPKLKTLGSRENRRTQGEDLSHVGPRYSVKVTLKHTKTTQAEDEDWQRDLIQRKGAQAL